MRNLSVHKTMVVFIYLLLFLSNNTEIFSKNTTGIDPANPCDFDNPSDSSISYNLPSSANSLLGANQISPEWRDILASNFESKVWNRGKRYLIVATVSNDYVNKDWNNSISDLDGNGIAEAFSKLGYTSPDSPDSKSPIVLNGSEVLRKPLLDTIKTCKKNGDETIPCAINGEDTLLIYIIAHGQVDNQTEFRLYTPDNGASGYDTLTFTDIVGALQPSNELDNTAKEGFHKTFIILDTCYSGKSIQTGISTTL